MAHQHKYADNITLQQAKLGKADIITLLFYSIIIPIKRQRAVQFKYRNRRNFTFQIKGTIFQYDASWNNKLHFDNTILHYK